MNWKRPISLALSALLAASLAVPALAADEPWYAKAQSYVTEKGIMTSTGKGFEPDGVVTRATVFQTLWNMEGKPAPAAPSGFADVAANAWYASSAAWSKAQGLTTSTGHNNYSGDRQLTRAELVTILYRYAQLKGLDVSVGESTNIKPYADVRDVADWAMSAFQWAKGAGVVDGKTKVNLITGDAELFLAPADTASRAELANVLMKLDQLFPVAEDVDYVEKTVSYQSEGRTVPAVVTLPVGEGPFPAVVINHGHGGSKDENVGFIGVARALAKAGYASIRMDFAGCGDSTAPFTENTLSNMEADSNAGLAYLLKNYDVDADRLGILGYSMGGRLALEIVSKKDNPYKAVVLLSAAAYPGEVGVKNLLGDLTVADAKKIIADKGSYDYTTQYGQNLSLSAEWFDDMMVDPLAEIDNFKGPMLVLHGDKDVVVDDETNKLITAAYPAAQEIIVPDADHGYGFYSDQPQVTAMVEGSIVDFFNRGLSAAATLQTYLSDGGEDWFLTGKSEYTIQGMMVSKDTPYENVLEGNSGVVTNDGVTVLLKGTADELWPAKLEKVSKTYTTANGKAVTKNTFAKKDSYVYLKTKAEPDTNFAMFVPADVQVMVETAWGEVLMANRPGVEHGAGDYLVCAAKDGKPDLSDVWVVNGAIFPNTYDMIRKPVTGTVTEIEKYGHAVLDVKIADFEANGFALGDTVTVTAGDFSKDMPYLDGYYVDSGEYMLRAYPGKEYLAVCINYGKFSEEAKVDVGSEVTVTLKEKEGALALQATYSLKYTDERSDYASDEVFANFREVTVGDIAAGKLYRSASPVNNEHNRATYADALIKAAGVKAVMNMADTQEEIDEYVAAEDFASPYYKSLLDAGKVAVLGMPVNYASDEFAEGVVKGLTFLAQNEGPYLIHCTEGKDRAGCASAFVEALMGASVEEIVADYMKSYENYYGVKAGDDKYDLIAEGNVKEMLRAMAGLDKGADLTGVDLAKAAETYLTSHGMKAEDLNALKANLSK